MSQEQLNTESILMSKEALVLITQHEKVCSERWASLQAMLSSRFKETRDEVKSIKTYLLTTVGGSFMVLLAIIGYLINKHGI